MHIAILPKDRFIQITTREGTKCLTIDKERFPDAPMGYTADPERPFLVIWWDPKEQAGLIERENPVRARSTIKASFYDPEILEPYLRAFAAQKAIDDEQQREGRAA